MPHHISLDFVVGLPRTQMTKDGSFCPLHKTLDASHAAELHFREIIKRTLWRKLGTILQFISAYHPQIEVVNRSLGNLLRSFVGKNIRQWDLLLAQAEFAYNRSTSQTTGCSPFEVVYGLNPISPLDLAPISTTIQI